MQAANNKALTGQNEVITTALSHEDAGLQFSQQNWAVDKGDKKQPLLQYASSTFPDLLTKILGVET
jgi:hypothetical protein